MKRAYRDFPSTSCSPHIHSLLHYHQNGAFSYQGGTYTDTSKSLVYPREKHGTLHRFACLSCAGAMLIFLETYILPGKAYLFSLLWLSGKHSLKRIDFTYLERKVPSFRLYTFLHFVCEWASGVCCEE